MTVKDAHAYWNSPEECNTPDKYATDDPIKSRMLVSLIQRLSLPNDASILELGCNCGRNLHHLQQSGFTDLHGIEISIGAVSAMHEHYPDLCAAVHVASIEDCISTLGQFDLIFSMAVLEHIHPSSEWIFPHIEQRCRYLITIEDEVSSGSRHFPRQYDLVFPNLRQLRAFGNLPGLSNSFRARVFKKEEV